MMVATMPAHVDRLASRFCCSWRPPASGCRSLFGAHGQRAGQRQSRAAQAPTIAELAELQGDESRP